MKSLSKYDKLNIGDVIIPKYEYWRAFISIHEDLIESALDLYPPELLIYNVYYLGNHKGDSYAHEIEFKGEKAYIFMRDIDEVVERMRL